MASLLYKSGEGFALSGKVFMKMILVILILGISKLSIAQSRISLYGGWTASKIRASYPSSTQPGPIFGDFTEFPVWHSPYYGGLEYEYDHKRLRISTGLSFMAFGSSNSISFRSHPWVAYYWTVPILTGYNFVLSKDFYLTIEGGVDIGFQQGNSDLIGVGALWGNVNAIIGLETEWKRFRLGVRGHWGLTNFRKFSVFTYKHTGLTTYLGYTLWDHAKSKAKRLKKHQEKQLE